MTTVICGDSHTAHWPTASGETCRRCGADMTLYRLVVEVREMSAAFNAWDPEVVIAKLAESPRQAAWALTQEAEVHELATNQGQADAFYALAERAAELHR